MSQVFKIAGSRLRFSPVVGGGKGKVKVRRRQVGTCICVGSCPLQEEDREGLVAVECAVVRPNDLHEGRVIHPLMLKKCVLANLSGVHLQLLGWVFFCRHKPEAQRLGGYSC